MIAVVRAPPFATVQDLGRGGHRSQGVPPSGAMDRDALVIGNLLVGNPEDGSGIEWALGPGRIRFAERRRFVLTGAETGSALDGEPVPAWTVVGARAGSELDLGVPLTERFGYLVIEGGIATPEVLGSRSTYLTGRFGGVEGRLLRAGDSLALLAPTGRAAARGTRCLPEFHSAAEPAVRVVEGPQAEFFAPDSWGPLEEGRYRLAGTADRMGYRLEGPVLTHSAQASLPSEPVCVGAIQVPDGGMPIVLMPDGPTVGGYPKLAVVVSVDLGILAQHRPGDAIRFRRISLAEAHEALDAQRHRLRELAEWVRGRAAG
jgi:antagonist of KipI